MQQAWRLASTSVGGRLRIARNPNQGIFCSWGQKTLKNLLIFGCALRAQKAEGRFGRFSLWEE